MRIPSFRRALGAALLTSALALTSAVTVAADLKIAVAADRATKKGVTYVPRTDEYTLAFQFKQAKS